MTTINEMLEQGIAMQGQMCVVCIDGMGEEHVYFEGADEWRGPVDGAWADKEIKYMFATDGCDGAMLRIEVESPDDEWMKWEAEQKWACADCADWYSPSDGPILEYDNGSWTCPSCGCTTVAPAEDACYRIG